MALWRCNFSLRLMFLRENLLADGGDGGVGEMIVVQKRWMAFRMTSDLLPPLHRGVWRQQAREELPPLA